MAFFVIFITSSLICLYVWLHRSLIPCSLAWKTTFTPNNHKIEWGLKENKTGRMAQQKIFELDYLLLSVSLTCKVNYRLYSSLAIGIVYQYHFRLILWLIYQIKATSHSLQVLNGMSSAITLIWFHSGQILKSSDRLVEGKRIYFSFQNYLL